MSPPNLAAAYYRRNPIQAVRRNTVVDGRPVSTLAEWIPWYVDRFDTVVDAREGDLIAQAVCDALGWSRKWQATNGKGACAEWHVTIEGARKCAKKHGPEWWVEDYIGRRV